MSTSLDLRPSKNKPAKIGDASELSDQIRQVTEGRVAAPAKAGKPPENGLTSGGVTTGAVWRTTESVAANRPAEASQIDNTDAINGEMMARGGPLHPSLGVFIGGPYKGQTPAQVLRSLDTKKTRTATQGGEFGGGKTSEEGWRKLFPSAPVAAAPSAAAQAPQLPFRGSTPAEIAEFKAGGPNPSDLAIQSFAKTGATMTTPYGTMASTTATRQPSQVAPSPAPIHPATKTAARDTGTVMGPPAPAVGRDSGSFAGPVRPGIARDTGAVMGPVRPGIARDTGAVMGPVRPGIARETGAQMGPQRPVAARPTGPAGPFYNTTGAVDAFRKGNLSATANHLISSVAGGIHSAAKGTAAEGSVIDRFTGKIVNKMGTPPEKVSRGEAAFRSGISSQPKTAKKPNELVS